MGSYTFRWAHPAEQVFVTGTFDNWGKTVLLDKKGSVHEKSVALPATTEKLLYKFFADGSWKHDHTAKTETDHEGNVNNVLYPSDYQSTSATNAAHPFISSVAPGATTAAMAAQQPLEDKAPAPGAFPETPAADNDHAFSVNPIPATGGIGNPVQLRPGEKVPDPSSITGNTIQSNVTLDKDSYEKSSTGAPVLPAPLSPQSEREAYGAPIFGLGPQTSNMIPESSMPMGKDMPPPIDSQDAGPVISSVAPNSTTNELAGLQPKEPRLPAVVSESQQAANAAPEASANPEAVREKEQMENELQSKVPEAPPASDQQTKTGNTIYGMAAGGLAAAGAAAAGTAYAMRDKIHQTTGTDPVAVLPQSVQDSINNMNNKGTTGSSAAGAAGPITSSAAPPQQSAAGEEAKFPADGDHARATTHEVPDVVAASQKEAHADPEAAVSTEAVREKEEMEKELLKKVPESDAQGQPAPNASAGPASTAPAASAEKSASGAPQLGHPTSGGLAPLSMDDKSADKGALNASAATPAEPPEGQPSNLAVRSGAYDSRDVSPMTKPATTGQEQPTVTTGVDSSDAPAESKPASSQPVDTSKKNGGSKDTTPRRQSFFGKAKGTPDSQATSGSAASGSGEKKEKKGFFSRIKDRLK